MILWKLKKDVLDNTGEKIKVDASGKVKKGQGVSLPQEYTNSTRETSLSQPPQGCGVQERLCTGCAVERVSFLGVTLFSYIRKKGNKGGFLP